MQDVFPFRKPRRATAIALPSSSIRTTRNRMHQSKDEVNLRRLSQKHRELDERLTVLAGRRFLTEPEQFEESTLKKLKLKVKDEIESILAGRPDRTGRHG
jgi:uncharacterized protein YdcH (DUF465 family)